MTAPSKKESFIERFVEVCGGTREPAKVQRLLNVSYQAAKNYLRGRIPDSTVLLKIAQLTDYSVNWLLTGEGEKFVAGRVGAPVTAGQMRDLFREEREKLISELGLVREPAEPKVVVLNSADLRSEKVRETEIISDPETE